MSLIDLLGAASEEVIGLLAAGGGRASAREAAVGLRLRRFFRRATIGSVVVFGACWLLARWLPDSPVATWAAYGLYAALMTALMGALGWAYAWAALRQAAPRRGRDA